LRITKADAGRRIAEAGDLGERRALTGEALAPLLSATATAQRQGLVGDGHEAVIRSFFARLPAEVDLGTREAAEADLAGNAGGNRPDELVRRNHLCHCDFRGIRAGIVSEAGDSIRAWGSREVIDEAFDVLSTAVLRACDLTFDALTPRDLSACPESGPLSGPHSCLNTLIDAQWILPGSTTRLSANERIRR
jgi:hypothetical protein